MSELTEADCDFLYKVRRERDRCAKSVDNFEKHLELRGLLNVVGSQLDDAIRDATMLDLCHRILETSEKFSEWPDRAQRLGYLTVVRDHLREEVALRAQRLGADNYHLRCVLRAHARALRWAEGKL